MKNISNDIMSALQDRYDPIKSYPNFSYTDPAISKYNNWFNELNTMAFYAKL